MYLHVGFDETAGNQTSLKQGNIILNWMLAFMQKFDYLFSPIYCKSFASLHRWRGPASEDWSQKEAWLILYQGTRDNECSKLHGVGFEISGSKGVASEHDESKYGVGIMITQLMTPPKIK